MAFLLIYIGKTVYALLKELAYPHAPNTLTVANIRQYIVDHVKPRHFETHARAIFNSLVRKVDQSVSEFILLLQKQAMKCNFGDQLDNHLRDRLVAGINDDSIKKKLLTDSNLLWTSARDIAISHSSV